MTIPSSAPRELRMIPVDRIDVLNSRERNQIVFDDIVENIKKIGLKKPVTVTVRPGADGAERYLLVCGEGRLKAFRKLGEARIPALVVDVSEEDAYLMSLSENVARRQYRPLELLAGISELKSKGYDAKDIARKTGLTLVYVYDILVLIDQGEERLLAGVQTGSIPLSSAIAIVRAGNDDKAIQAAMQQAYEDGSLRGRQLLDARRLVDRRRQLGRSLARGLPRKSTGVTSASLVRTYQLEVQRQQSLVRKASFAQQHVMFVVGALRQLLTDDNFVNLLRAENLDCLPKYLAERVSLGGST